MSLFCKNKEHGYDSAIFNDWHDNPKRKRRSRKLKQLTNNVVLIGAPNVGKSTFFNKITNGTAAVSNIDRLTVSDTIAKLKVDKTINVIDLPGLYNLSHPIDEELVVAHEITQEHFTKIINVIGAQSFERDLYLTIQTLETGLMSTLAINMMDEVNRSQINLDKLSKKLNGVKVIECQANKNIGTKKSAKSILEDKPVDAHVLKYSSRIEKLISQISAILPQRKISNRYYSLMFLEGNEFIIDWYKKHENEAFLKVKKTLDKIDQSLIANEIELTRKQFISKITKECFVSFETFLSKNKNKQTNFDIKILKKWIGIPAFFLLLVLIYYLTFGPYAGGSLKDLFGETFLNGIVADKWLSHLFDLMHASEWTKGLFIDGIFKGFFSVLSFAPTLIILFTLVNIIQQVGILSRISVLLDNALSKFGISGRSVVTLLTGFGCNVPAIMMARSSNSKKEKIISILISPFIVCSARIIVISFVCNAIFTSTYGWIGMILLVFFSGFVALMMGLIFSKTMFRKTKSFFMIEMVDWRKPDFLVIAKLVWLELKEFIKKAGTIIVLANLLIWLFLHLGPTGTLGDDNIDTSFVAYISKGINYLMYPVGFYSEDSWKLTASLITAFPAKEIAVANIQLLFGTEEAFATYISQGTHIAQGLSYLVIFAFYLPCAATIGAIKKESNWKTLGIQVGSSVCLSYLLGIIVYWITYGFLLI